MSILVINGQLSCFGQVDSPPLDVNQTIREIYAGIIATCKENYDPNICDALLPVNPIFLPPKTETSFLRAPIFWFLAGALAYRILLGR